MKSHSQFKEDLMLYEFFKKTNIAEGFFFEFGAWDGIYLSNCRLFYEQGWKGCFVEADKKRFEDLKKNYSNDSKVTLLNEYINLTDNSLDKIFERNEIKDIDLLSIDIDSRDLSIWKSISIIRPKFVIIEYNQFIPFDVDYEDITDKNIGNSILAIDRFAAKKNYELIGSSFTNLIFVDKLFNQERIQNIDINYVYDKIKPLRLGHNWKGEMLFFENNELSIKEYFTHPQQKNFILFQPIPKLLRKVSDVDGSGWKKIKIIYSHFVLLILRPNLFFLKVINKFRKKNNKD